MLYQHEQDYFRMQIRRVNDAGANVVLCQWGFDDEANYLLLANGFVRIPRSHNSATSQFRDLFS